MTRCFYSQVLYAKSSEISPEKPNSFATMKKVPYSFVSVSEQFIKSVEKMESVVLVPTKLLDIPIHSDNSSQTSPIIIPEITASGHSNLFEVFHLVKKFKEKLLGINSSIGQDDEFSANTSLEVDDTIYSFRQSPIPPNQPMVTITCEGSAEAKAPSVVSSTGLNHTHDSGNWSSSSLVDASGSVESVSLQTSHLECGYSIAKHSTGANDGAKGVGSCSTCSSVTSNSDSSEVSDIESDSGLQFLPSSALDSSTHNLTSSAASCPGVVQASCVVRKSLHSAKSLCAFLVDLRAVTQFIMDRYLEELDCGYSE